MQSSKHQSPSNKLYLTHFPFIQLPVEIRQNFVGYLDGFGLPSAISVKPKWLDCFNSPPDARNCHQADFRYVQMRRKIHSNQIYYFFSPGIESTFSNNRRANLWQFADRTHMLQSTLFARLRKLRALWESSPSSHQRRNRRLWDGLN